MKRGLIALGLAAALAITGYVLRPHGLWALTQVCVADSRLTGSPWPCLEVSAETLVFRPFWAPDLVLAPRRDIVGIEDPFLQTPEAPNYFAAAWKARRFLPPDASDIALIVNPAVARSQAHLHIHIGCLQPRFRAGLARAAAQASAEGWTKLPEIVPHIAFWGARIGAADLDAAAPFRAAALALAGEVKDRALITLALAGVEADGAPEFLMFASYAGAPHSWWAVGAENMMDTKCAP